MVYIYILKLQDNKYYIGKTDNIDKRYQEHMNGTASSYTKKYKPISIEKIIPDASPYDEYKYTIEYMGKYGLNHVRGGVYVREALDSSEIYHINKQIWGATNCCTQCGRKGHFVKMCKFTKDVNGLDIYVNSECIIDKNKLQPYKSKKNKKTCDRCGRNSHTIDDCYAKKDINWETIEESEEEAFCCNYCDKECDTLK